MFGEGHTMTKHGTLQSIGSNSNSKTHSHGTKVLGDGLRGGERIKSDQSSCSGDGGGGGHW